MFSPQRSNSFIALVNETQSLWVTQPAPECVNMILAWYAQAEGMVHDDYSWSVHAASWQNWLEELALEC